MEEEVKRIHELYSTEVGKGNSGGVEEVRWGWTNEWDRLLQIEEGTPVPEEEEVVVECDIVRYAPVLVRAVEFFFNPWIIFISCYLYIHTIVARIILLTDDIGASIVALISVVQGLISVLMIGGIIKGSLFDPIGRNKMVRIRSTEFVSTRHFVRANWLMDCLHDWQVFMCENVACRIFQPSEYGPKPTSIFGRCWQWVTKVCLQCGKRSVPPENRFGEHPLIRFLCCSHCGHSEIRYRKASDIFQAYGFFDLIEKGTKFTVHNWTKSFIPDRQTEYFMSIFITVLALQTMYAIFIQNAEYRLCTRDYPVESFDYCSSSFDDYRNSRDTDVEVDSQFSFKFCCRLSKEFALFGAFVINNLANTFGTSILIVGLTTLLYGANVLNAMGVAWIQRYREATPEDVTKERQSKIRANQLADLAAAAVRGHSHSHSHSTELSRASAAARAEIKEVALPLAHVISASLGALPQKRVDGCGTVEGHRHQHRVCIFTDTVLNQVRISACEAFYGAFHAAFIELRRSNSRGSSLYAAYMSIRAAGDAGDDVFADLVVRACPELKKCSSRSAAAGRFSEEYLCLQQAYQTAMSKFIELSQWSSSSALHADGDGDGDYDSGGGGDGGEEWFDEGGGGTSAALGPGRLIRSAASIDAEMALEQLQAALEEHQDKEVRNFRRLFKRINTRYNTMQNFPDYADLGLDATISVPLIKMAVTMFRRYKQLLAEASRAAARAVKEDEAALGAEDLVFLPNRGQDRIYRRLQNIIEFDNQRRRRAQSLHREVDVESVDYEAINTMSYAVAFVSAYHCIDEALRKEAALETPAQSPKPAGRHSSSSAGSSGELPPRRSTPPPGAGRASSDDGVDTIAQAFLVMGVCADVAATAAAEQHGTWPTDLAALYSDVFDIAFARYDRISRPKKHLTGIQRLASQLTELSAAAASSATTAAAVAAATARADEEGNKEADSGPADASNKLVEDDAKEMYCFIEQFSAQSSNIWKVLLAEEFLVRPALLVYAYYVIINSVHGGTIDTDLLGSTVWLGSLMTFLITFYMYAMAYANMVTPRITRALRLFPFCDFKYFGDRSDMISFIEDRNIEWGIFGFVINRSLLFSVGGGLLTGLVATLAALYF